MTHLALKDDLLDGQLLRAVGAAPYGGADVGECLATARRVIERVEQGPGVLFKACHRGLRHESSFACAGAWRPRISSFHFRTNA